MKKSPGEIKFERHCKVTGSSEKWDDLDDATRLAWEKIATEDDDQGGDAPPPAGPGQGPGGQ
jgi:hypothetical protein